MQSSGAGPSWLRRHAPLLILLGVGLLVRLVLVPIPGHRGDVMVMARWAEHLAEFGPTAFYAHDNSIYPALLPFFWPLGVLLDGDALSTAIKGLSIPFDLVMAVLLYTVVARRTDRTLGNQAAMLYLLNPAVLIAGPVWGQVDAAGTLLFVAALVALAGNRFALAGALAALAGLAKPQFGLVALVVVVVAVLAWQRTGRWRPLVRSLIGMAVAAAAVSVTFGLWPTTWFGLVADAAAFKPMTSLNAPNMWALLVGFSVNDGPYVLIGAVLLLAGLAASLLPLRRGHDLATVLTVGLLMALAFYFLPTRVHERYLFPVMAVAIPLTVIESRLLAAYAALSVAFALSLLRAMVDTTAFSLPQAYAELLLWGPMTWLIGLTLIGSAITLVRLTAFSKGKAERVPDSHPMTAI